MSNDNTQHIHRFNGNYYAGEDVNEYGIDGDFSVNKNNGASSPYFGPIEDYELIFYIKPIAPEKTAKHLVLPTILYAVAITLTMFAVIWMFA